MKKSKNNPLLAATGDEGKKANPVGIASEKPMPGAKSGNGGAKGAGNGRGVRAAKASEAAVVAAAAALLAQKKMEEALARGAALKRGEPLPKLSASEIRTLRDLFRSLPEYDDEGLKFNTPGLHYVGEDPEPVPPPSGGAKVKLDLASRRDAEVAAFAEAHVVSMTGNPNFPSPTPTAVVFAEGLSDFEAKLALVESRRLELKQLVEEKDLARAVLSNLLNQRGAYVESASNGNADLILSAGLPLRKARSKVGELSWPTDLRVEQSQTVGALYITWKSVRYSRGYMLQCAEVVEGQERDWKQVYAGGKFSTLQKNLVPGKTYEFRVATMGGTTGLSEWSPIVSRMAA